MYRRLDSPVSLPLVSFPLVSLPLFSFITFRTATIPASALALSLLAVGVVPSILEVKLGDESSFLPSFPLSVERQLKACRSRHAGTQNTSAPHTRHHIIYYLQTTSPHSVHWCCCRRCQARLPGSSARRVSCQLVPTTIHPLQQHRSHRPRTKAPSSVESACDLNPVPPGKP